MFFPTLTIIYLLLNPALGAVVDYDPGVFQCEYYNISMPANESELNRVETCSPSEDSKSYYCFVLWRRSENGTLEVHLKGCLVNQECTGPNSTSKCHEHDNKEVKDHQIHRFCCCDGNMCNQNITWVAPVTEPPPAVTTLPAHLNDSISLTDTLVLVIVLSCVLGGSIAGFLWYRKNKAFNELPSSDPHPAPSPSPYLDLRPIQLIEIKARGRFGAVWKAKFKSEEVAVKIFPIQDKQSWMTEKDIFKLPHMDHPNILQYIGVEKRGDNLQAEFWLITAYHERGSLCDFLKAHTLTWAELVRIAETMARGLMHLHEAIPGKTQEDCMKPAVAHRDFKSKNVLLKSDMSACIADFGLAIVFEAGKSCGDTHGQVGTRRYMAPEVLEGAINFTRDAFLRIDMYACGLVLWELVSRCTAQDGPIPEYRLPFEEEVGQHPSLEDMQESVVQRKVRPVIQEHWRHHLGLAAMCDTMEECWDHDAEARLTASCVVERVMMQTRYQTAALTLRIENGSVLSKETSM